MEPIKIHVSGAGASLVQTQEITAGMVGLPVAFTFDPTWNDLTKSAIFRAGGVSRMIVCIDDAAQVPPEVLTQPRYDLEIGVLGLDESGSVVIPTVWLHVGTIREGTDQAAQEAAQPTQPAWQQAIAKVGSMERQLLTAMENIATVGKAAQQIIDNEQLLEALTDGDEVEY